MMYLLLLVFTKLDLQLIIGKKNWPPVWPEFHFRSPITHRRIIGNLIFQHGRLARWIKWRACDVGEAKKGWRMNCDVGEATHSPTFPSLHLRHSSFAHSPTFPSLHLSHSSFSNLSVASPKSQLILQPFRFFTYVTAHSPTLPLLHLRHSSFSNLSFASPTSQALHLIHLASRPCISVS